MYNIYVLRSLKNGKKYVGFTGKDPIARLKEHNKGSNTWTRQNRPFALIYTEEFEDKKLAEQRERFFKSTTGRRQLDHILRARSSTG